MTLRLFTNTISHISRTAAAWILSLGLVLIGIGGLIAVLPKVFAYLAAMIFFIAGGACVLAAIKIFLAQRRFDKLRDNQSDIYRENVRIRIEE